MDGFGLNAYDGSGNIRTTYYGESYVRSYIKLAPNAVVILNHACYSAGSSEPGRANPTLTVARKRVDNFGAGFLRAGARAVFARRWPAPRTSSARSSPPTRRCPRSSGATRHARSPTRARSSSVRTAGATVVLDPHEPGTYHRSVVGDLSMTATTWRP